MDKYLYFRAVADEDNDDGDGASSGINPTSLIIPAKNITGIGPGNGTTLLIFFKSVRNGKGHAGASEDEIVQDSVTLTIASHTHKAITDTIIRAINSTGPNYSDGFIDVCDDVTTNAADETVDAVRLHSSIEGIADNRIAVAAALS
tara:strand:- start:493 stop:930 length:438 start_codon:yes stop_codon:yes gene_type:complete